MEPLSKGPKESEERATERKREIIMRAEKLGLHFVEKAPGGNVGQTSGDPLALPETQLIVAQRRVNITSTPEVEKLN